MHRPDAPPPGGAMLKNARTPVAKPVSIFAE
jgi:hypothetical protein